MTLTFFKEEPHLIPRLQKVLVAHMIALLARAELGHGMVFQREVIEHLIRFSQQLCDLCLRQGVRDQEVAIRVPELQLLLREAFR